MSEETATTEPKPIKLYRWIPVGLKHEIVARVDAACKRMGLHRHRAKYVEEAVLTRLAQDEAGRNVSDDPTADEREEEPTVSDNTVA
jgi:hypothetical protein